MIFAYFTLLVALVISAVAEYYSIVGLTAIFSTVFWPIIIMGAALGVGKITAAVWLKLNWERASWTYKLYLVPAVAFLMVLTSMGIFGFLSKAHSDQNLVSGDSIAKVAIYDEKIKTAKDNIGTNRTALKQMDAAVDQVMGRSNDEKGADKAVGIRRSQSRERTRLLAEIEVEQKKVAALSEERAPHAAEFRRIENEVGPIKYIAALVYGDNPDANILEKAVRLVIILIVAVFDPLALVLILAAQQSLRWVKEEKDDQGQQAFLAPTQPSGSGLTIDDQIAEADAASDDAGPIAQKVAEEPHTIEEPTSILAQHPYLAQPFAHFKDLKPMVYKPEDDVAAMSIVPPEEDETRPFTEEEIMALDGINEEEFLEQFDKNLAKGHEIESPILTMGIDEVERPGDYITPPDTEVHFIHDSDHIHHEGRSYSIDAFKSQFPELSALADNHPSLGNAARADFGTSFPKSAAKGDLFLRTDYLPSKLFKWNSAKWLEVDKTFTDAYAYNEQYIKHLVDKIATGEYDVEDLSEVEEAQVAAYLKNMPKD